MPIGVFESISGTLHLALKLSEAAEAFIWAAADLFIIIVA